MEPEPKRAFAWQPLTPAGVAAFAETSCRRLWLVQLLVAMVAAATMVWFLAVNWFPVVGAGIRRLPAEGEIRFARLNWNSDSPVGLAENHFLAWMVDLKHQGLVRAPAHVQVELGETDCEVFSLFGMLQFPYPRGWVIALNRGECEPWWGAWAPMILALAALGTVGGLLVVWGVLASVYALPAWLVAFFANRELTVSGSWKLCGAALMPGALLFTLSIILYGLALLDVPKLLVAFVAHFALGWGYVVAGVWFRPRIAGDGSRKMNPFVKPAEPPSTPAEPENRA